MKFFLKKICIYLILFISLLVVIFFINNGKLNIDFNKYKNKIFFKKVELFSDFIDKNQSINLILGSSLVQCSIIPDSIGTKWFSFATDIQNIYESYKFIYYYKDLVKIDTIILGVQPFDFPISYIKNRKDNKPYINGNFHLFGKDSITFRKENSLLRDIQFIKDENYFDIEKLKTKIKNIIVPGGGSKKNIVWTKQGFSRRYFHYIDLDSLFITDPNSFSGHLRYFVNVKSPPNLFYFDLFESLTRSLGITVIYLITPKSKYYHLGMKEEKYDEIWNDILDSLEIRPIELWNYDTLATDTINSQYFWDDTHLSHNGAKSFTKMIRNRLYQVSE